MGMHVYVGNVQSETFDYEIAKASKGDYYGYFPDRITPYLESNGLYGIIMDHNDVVQTDWGCWVVKMQKEDILSHVIQWGSVVDHKWLVEFLEYGTDYLLVAYEGV